MSTLATLNHYNLSVMCRGGSRVIKKGGVVGIAMGRALHTRGVKFWARYINSGAFSAVTTKYTKLIF